MCEKENEAKQKHIRPDVISGRICFLCFVIVVLLNILKNSFTS